VADPVLLRGFDEPPGCLAVAKRKPEINPDMDVRWTMRTLERAKGEGKKEKKKGQDRSCPFSLLSGREATA
jgi:hypothetical protein